MKRLLASLSLLLAMAPAGYAQKVYITGFSGLSVVDPTNIQNQDTVCCGNMVYVAKSFDSSRVYITHWNSDRLYYINTGTNTITDSMNLRVWDVISDNASDKLFASQTINNAVYIINPIAKTYDSVIVNSPNMLEKRPGQKEIWVTNDNQFSVIDYNSTPVVNSYTIATGGTLSRDEVRFTKDGATALVINSLGDKVYKVNANTKAITDSVTNTPIFGIEIAADGSMFYLSAPLKNKIYIYNLSTMALTDSILTKRNPFTMYTSPYNATQLWVVDHNQDSLTIYNTTSKAGIDSTGITSSPYYVVFNKQGPGAVGDMSVAAALPFYPNPVTGVLQLKQKAASVSVYTIAGKLQYHCENCRTIDVSQWVKGNYILQLRDKDQAGTWKLLVQ